MPFYPTKGTDLYEVGAAGSTRVLLQDGSLLCKDVKIARTGYMDYLMSELTLDERDRNEIVKVRRDPSQLFNEKVIKSFEQVPVTLDHPPEDVNPDNFKKYVVGNIRNVRRDGDYLVADLIVRDRDAINSIMSGDTVEVSPGYTNDFVYDEDRQEWTQQNLLGNHLAIVRRGRGGRSVRIGDSSMKLSSRVMSRIKRMAIRDAENEVDELRRDLNDDESVAERHEDEVRGGEKANRILEGERREAEREGRRFEDTRDDDVIAELFDRVDKLESMVGMILAGDAVQDDESVAERHEDEVRGGEIAEGEYEEKKVLGDACKDEDETSDPVAIEVTEDEAEDLMTDEEKEREGVLTGDKAMSYVASYTQGVAKILAPSLNMRVQDSYYEPASKKRMTINTIRRAALDSALRDPVHGEIARRVMKGRDLRRMDSRQVFDAFKRVGDRIARHNNGTVRQMTLDSDSLIGTPVTDVRRMQDTYNKFWRK